MRTALAILGITMTFAPGTGRTEPVAAAGGVQVHTRAGGKRLYVAPPEIIRGKVQRPEALLVLPRPKVTYELPELKRDLLPNIERDAARSPAP